ncbi:MFS transporter [Chitinophaga silvatica]|uniref:MFS transporter n=1 Tax=Chitinophaga silvatica TaxID=2282649 RepID=A0A3E1Y8T7_9BACT|nr:MFS transporter [Chitinophaga silvatica]RFS21815.1 MFS transporter [Chitinophaga silvatica]
MTEGKRSGTVWFMAPLVIGNMLNPLNSTMLATAIVTVCAAFGKDVGSGALLIVPLYLTSAIGQPLMGRLADIYSARKVNYAGFILILISALIGISARNFNWLIVSRILLGLGSSAAYPSAMTLIRQRYAQENEEVPGVILGVIAIASQVSLVFGPFLGGILTEHYGWIGIFWVNIPVVLLAMLLLVVENKRNVAGEILHNTTLSDLDIKGVIVFTVLLISFLLTLLYPVKLWLVIPALVILLFYFIRIELRHTNPFINVRLLVMNQLLSTTFLRQVALTFVMYLTLYGLPQWLEQTKHINPSKVGLMMLPLSLAAMVTSLLASKNRNYKQLLIIGTASIAFATSGLFLINAQASLWIALITSVLIGIAIGVMTIANQATLYAAAPLDQVGISFGLFRTVGYFGAIIAGSRLKHEFKAGATDVGLHQLAIYSLIAAMVIILLLIPILKNKQTK